MGFSDFRHVSGPPRPEGGKRTDSAVARMAFTVSVGGVLLAGFEDEWKANAFASHREGAVVAARVKRG